VKAAVAAEAVGIDPGRERTFRQLGIGADMYRSRRPWVAELLGPCPVYGYQRSFLDAEIDYTNANGRGTRGVMYRWVLESGRFYQAQYPTNWTRVERRFLTVTKDGDVEDITEDLILARWEEMEVRRRWESVDSELTF